MHLVTLSLHIARLLRKMIEDRNEFAHEEQEEMKSDLKQIKKALGIETTE